MDGIDCALQSAWLAMLERIERDPEELARRRARAQRIRQRPVRAWCMALRAGDRRIDEWGLSWSVDDDARHGRAHTVRITQWDLHDLTRPIDLAPWPGVAVSEAARLLGRDHATVLRWARMGALRHEVYDRRVFGLGGTFGGPMLSVWSPSLIDPNAECARPPHIAWGTLWQHLARHVPREWACELQRVPTARVCDRGGPRWAWECPGLGVGGESGERRTENGERGGCGRLCHKVYLPLPCWTVANHRGEIESLGIPIPVWADLMGRPMACRHCWGIVSERISGRHGWNLFVSHLTGGLLTGREVPRPQEEAPLERRRQTYRRGWSPQAARRRERVRGLLLSGATYAQIAEELGIRRTMVANDVKQLYRRAGLEPGRGGRWALAGKVEWGWPVEVDVGGKLGLSGRRAELAQLLVRGGSTGEIAEELGIRRQSVCALAHQIYRQLGIHSRGELRALCGIRPELQAVAGVGAGEGGEARDAVRAAG